MSSGYFPVPAYSRPVVAAANGVALAVAASGDDGSDVDAAALTGFATADLDADAVFAMSPGK